MYFIANLRLFLQSASDVFSEKTDAPVFILSFFEKNAIFTQCLGCD